MLEHGGRLEAAVRQYGIPRHRWLDLSTGINPHGYPLPAVPESVWRRLPEEDDGLLTVAADYYGSGQLLAVPGTQGAIQTLPTLLPPCPVGVLSPGYGEHAHQWRRHGHRVESLLPARIGAALERLTVLVVIQPNNPTGHRFDRQQLLGWREVLSRKGGWLVVDEAFIDSSAGDSLADQAGVEGLVVLRSLGKFFGLAGARVGFVLAADGLRRELAAALGPWTVSGPGRWAAALALADREWQAATRRRLEVDSRRLARLLTDHGLGPDGGCGLFQWLEHRRSDVVRDQLARRGILIRRFEDHAGLRFGLPGSEAEWQRLTEALEAVGKIID